MLFSDHNGSLLRQQPGVAYFSIRPQVADIDVLRVCSMSSKQSSSQAKEQSGKACKSRKMPNMLVGQSIHNPGILGSLDRTA